MSLDETLEGEFGVFATEGLVLALLVEASVTLDDGGGELKDDGFDRVGGRPAFGGKKFHADGPPVQDETDGEVRRYL